MTITAKQILDLLVVRHSKDVFVPECKDGPSQNGSFHRMDAWAMSRSWAHPCVTAHEIKVSRADFVKDQKWTAYLDLCNQFYFATAPGVCDVREIPQDAGLLIASSNGARLFVKKKAPYRDVTIPEDVWRYVLMCRAKITHETDHRTNNLSFWKAWLTDKNQSRAIGWAVSRRIREVVAEKITEVQTEQRRLDAMLKNYEQVRLFLVGLGLDPDNGYQVNRDTVRREIERVQRAGADEMLRDVRSLERKLESFREQLEAASKMAACVPVASVPPPRSA